MLSKLSKKIIVAATISMVLQSGAHASGTIRLGRDVMPQTPNAPTFTSHTFNAHTFQNAYHPPLNTIYSSHRGGTMIQHNQRVLEQSANSITRNAINSATQEINRQVRNAIYDALR